MTKMDKISLFLLFKLCLIACLHGNNGDNMEVRVVYPEKGPTYLGSSLLLHCVVLSPATNTSGIRMLNGTTPTILNNDESFSNYHSSCSRIWTRSCAENIPCDLPDAAVALNLYSELHRQNIISLLYIKSLKSHHKGMYTCTLICEAVYSSSIQINPFMKDLNITTLSERKDDEIDGTTATSYFNDPSQTKGSNNFLVGIASAVGILIAIVTSYFLLARSRLLSPNRSSNRQTTTPSRARQEEQKPPTYDEVLSNPDKYPMSTPEVTIIHL